MNYPSLLYVSPPRTTPLDAELFDDLQLTQLMPDCRFDAVLAPCDRDELPHRQAFFRALEDTSFRHHLSRLLRSVRRMRFLYGALNDASCKPEYQVIFAAFLDEMLTFAHIAAKDEGEGLLRARFRDFFADLIAAPSTGQLIEDTRALAPRFEEIRHYTLHTHGKEIRIALPEKESFLDRIRRCNQNLGMEELDWKKERARILSPQIIEAFTVLHPDAFAAFAAYAEKHADCLHPEILDYESPLAFYLEMASMLDRVRAQNIPLTYPIPTDSRDIHIAEAYDISLLAKNEKNIIPNDIDFDESAPFFYLTGANGGGKTTYLRTVGIACVLLLLGAPIPARSANTAIPSGIFTHFPHDERFDGSGRFIEEHRRVESILARADRGSLILLNETYSTTNEENAIRMTVQLAEQIWERGNFGLYITHQHGLGKTEIPYLNVLVDKDDNNRRTFKIVRQQGSGGSFAADILRKYGLTRQDLERRFGGEL